MKPRRGTIWWGDAHGATSKQFDSVDDDLHSPMRVGSTGWVMRDDDVGATISFDYYPTLGAPHEQYEFRGYQFVPRGMIERVEYLTMPLVDCPRCYRGTMLYEDDELSCLQCGHRPMTEPPLDFEDFPAHRDGRQQRRTGARLKGDDAHVRQEAQGSRQRGVQSRAV